MSAALGLPADEIRHYHWSGYWDGPIDGWLYARGQFYYYEALGDALIFRHRIYGVYYVPKAYRVPHLLRHRGFSHQVGNHTSKKPGGPRKAFSEAAKPRWKAWYDANPGPAPKVEKKLLVGVTTLGNGFVHWLDNPADFDREWQYVEEEDEAA